MFGRDKSSEEQHQVEASANHDGVLPRAQAGGSSNTGNTSSRDQFLYDRGYRINNISAGDLESDQQGG
ncbi:unnamed protein product, partial [Amoebophrya sp. A25]